MKINKKITIAVGSENPVKTNAVKKALVKVFPAARYIAVSVKSGDI
jgi:non-canonical (house-cleaning) NTP pyrophosphatase